MPLRISNAQIELINQMRDNGTIIHHSGKAYRLDGPFTIPIMLSIFLALKTKGIIECSSSVKTTTCEVCFFTLTTFGKSIEF
jgi:hypothetical protein